MPNVSIIMPNYNGQDFVTKAIESVLAQTYTDWELVICDDCSTDNSLQIIEPYTQRDSRIKLIKNEVNRGVADTRNKAIELASGDYIAFLDSDDSWYPQKLELQMKELKSGAVDISYSSYHITTEGQNNEPYLVVAPNKVTYSDMLKGKRIGMLTSVVKKSLLPKPPFQNLKSEDLVMWLKILRGGYIARGIQTPLANYLLREQSLSSQKLHTAKSVWVIMRQEEKISLLKSKYYFACYILTMFAKYRNILLKVLRVR